MIRRNLYDAEHRPEARDILIPLIIVIFIFTIVVGVFQTTFVRGHSMDPTLYNGQQLITLKIGYKINHGDIVMVKHSEYGNIVKRVIGCPGDTVEIKDDKLYINSKQIQESYIAEPMSYSDIPAVTLGDDQYFIMGDNRDRSTDSRGFGSVSSNEIKGVIYLEHQTLLAILKIIILSLLSVALCTYLERKDAN